MKFESVVKGRFSVFRFKTLTAVFKDIEIVIKFEYVVMIL